MTEFKYEATKGICNAFNKAKIHYTISDEAGDDCIRLPIQISCGPILTAELSVIGDDGHVLNRPVTIAYSIPDHVRENVLLFLNHLNMSYPGYKFCLGYDGSVMVCYDRVVTVTEEEDENFYVRSYQKINEILNNEYLHLMQIIILADQENKDLGLAELSPSDKRFGAFLWSFCHVAVEDTDKAEKNFDNLIGGQDL